MVVLYLLNGFKPGVHRPLAKAQLFLKITFVHDVSMHACVCPPPKLVGVI